jgi:hypothetical protein
VQDTLKLMEKQKEEAEKRDRAEVLTGSENATYLSTRRLL